jgi:DNA-binding response OmpR family regulator
MANTGPTHRPVTIVAADDDSSIRQLLAAILTRCGYQVLLAENGSEAIALAHENEPDVVILDYNMPDLDGDQVAAVLRSSSTTAHLPLLLLSADEEADPRNCDGNDLWDGRVQKPFTPAALKSEIARLVSSEDRGVADVADDGRPVWEGIARPMRKNYLGSLKSAVEEMQQALESARDSDSRSAALESMRRRFHQIHGSAASYGFPGIGQVAAEAETLVSDWIEQADVDATVDLERLRTAVSSIDGLLARAVKASLGERNRGAGTERTQAAERARILLLGDDPQLLGEVSRGARQRGWNVESFQSTDAALQRAEQQAFDVITLSGDAAKEADCAVVNRFRFEAGSSALVLSGGDGSTAHRLRAVESGVHLYLTGNTSAGSMINEWRGLIEQSEPRAGRVLIVDDDRSILEFESAELREAGCDVACLDDAVDVFAQLEQQDPDLLLMDVDMPSANGLELAKAVRSSARWARLPIIIQTVHSSPEFRLRAFECGADDFLNKPILEEELRIRVLGRLERERMKRELAERDPATGFFSRQSFVDRTVKLLAECETGALATIEVERLTSFTHRYGLEAGDIAMTAITDALRDAFRSGRTVLGRVAGGVLTVMQGDVGEDELALKLERCFGNLEFDRRLAPGDSPADGVVLEASAVAVAAGQPVQAMLDDALRARRRDGRVRVTRVSRDAGAGAIPMFVIEDDKNLREMLEYALNNAGYLVQSFSNGCEALAALKAVDVCGQRPVVLLDVDLPGIDGFSILDELEAERPGVFSTVLLTARGSEKDQLRGLRANAADYIVKPVRIPLLLSRVGRIAAQNAS